MASKNGEHAQALANQIVQTIEMLNDYAEWIPTVPLWSNPLAIASNL